MSPRKKKPTINNINDEHYTLREKLYEWFCTQQQKGIKVQNDDIKHKFKDLHKLNCTKFANCTCKGGEHFVQSFKRMFGIKELGKSVSANSTVKEPKRNLSKSAIEEVTETFALVNKEKFIPHLDTIATNIGLIDVLYKARTKESDSELKSSFDNLIDLLCSKSCDSLEQIIENLKDK